MQGVGMEGWASGWKKNQPWLAQFGTEDAGCPAGDEAEAEAEAAQLAEAEASVRELAARLDMMRSELAQEISRVQSRLEREHFRHSREGGARDPLIDDMEATVCDLAGRLENLGRKVGDIQDLHA